MIILITALVELVVYSLLILVLFGLIRLFVVPSPRYPILPYGLALALGWLLSYPAFVIVLMATPRPALPSAELWEIFTFGFLPASIAVFFFALGRVPKTATSVAERTRWLSGFSALLGSASLIAAQYDSSLVALAVLSGLGVIVGTIALAARGNGKLTILLAVGGIAASLAIPVTALLIFSGIYGNAFVSH